MNLYGRTDSYQPYIADEAVYDAAETEDSGFDLRRIVGMLWGGRWIILICLVFSLIFAAAIISQMRPAYRASAKMIFTGQTRNIADLQQVLLNDAGRDQLQNEAEVLRSTNLIFNVVDKLNLIDNPVFAVSSRKSFSLSDLLDWRTYISPDLLANLGVISAPTPEPTDPADIERRRKMRITSRIQERLDLRPVPNSRVLSISYVSPSPALSRRIVDAVTTEYIESQLRYKVEATRQASEWLGDRIAELRSRVETSEFAVESARAEMAEETGQNADSTKQQLSALNGALATTRSERTRVATQYESALSVLRAPNADLGAYSLFRSADVIGTLRAKESDLVNRESALATFARDNPQREQIRAELDRVRTAIRAEAERIVEALESDLKVIREREDELQEEVNRLEEIEQAQNRGAVKMRQMEREAQASRVLYENFLARLEETQQQETLLSADARVLSPAEVEVVAAAKKRVLALGVIVGIGAGVGIIFLLNKLNNTFRGVKQLEDATRLPVLAVLPSVGSGMDRRDVIAMAREKPNGRLAEAVRNLRTSLLFGSSATPPRVVVFTSSVPSEGKSTSSLLLALTSQQMGRSAIIVDCDLRLHALSSLVGTDDDRPGLISVLKGTASLSEAVHIDKESGLRILTARPSERDEANSAADIVASRHFAELILQLTKTHDLVILDTPPVLAVTDARVIARYAQAVVYAVHWDKTPRGAVAEGLRELQSIDAPIAGLVMTMVDGDRAATYAYEGYGYYRSRYNEYYS